MVGSSYPHELEIKNYENYFKNNQIIPPKPNWVATDDHLCQEDMYSSLETMEDEDLINSILNNVDEIICNDNILCSANMNDQD